VHKHVSFREFNFFSPPTGVTEHASEAFNSRTRKIKEDNASPDGGKKKEDELPAEILQGFPKVVDPGWCKARFRGKQGSLATPPFHACTVLRETNRVLYPWSPERVPYPQYDEFFCVTPG
jgi:hypothetical protein